MINKQSKQRVTKVYNTIKAEYGKKFAQNMLTTLLRLEQNYSNLSLRETEQLLIEITKQN